MEPRHYWFCEIEDYKKFVGHGLPHDANTHYRRGCPFCFIGFMDNARTRNDFRIDGRKVAVYDMKKTRLWFFYLYKENANEG